MKVPSPSVQTLAFVPLTLIIPLTLCEISFHGRSDDCNGCGLSVRLVIGPNYAMNCGPHIISSMQGETFNGKNLFRSAFHNLPPPPAPINRTQCTFRITGEAAAKCAKLLFLSTLFYLCYKICVPRGAAMAPIRVPGTFLVGHVCFVFFSGWVSIASMFIQCWCVVLIVSTLLAGRQLWCGCILDAGAYAVCPPSDTVKTDCPAEANFCFPN